MKLSLKTKCQLPSDPTLSLIHHFILKLFIHEVFINLYYETIRPSSYCAIIQIRVFLLHMQLCGW